MRQRFTLHLARAERLTAFVQSALMDCFGGGGGGACHYIATHGTLPNKLASLTVTKQGELGPSNSRLASTVQRVYPSDFH